MPRQRTISKCCTKCGLEKPFEEFWDREKNKHRGGKVKKLCNACRTQRVRPKIPIINGTRTEKKCWRCEVVQPAINFSTNRSSPDGLNYTCRGCQRVLTHSTNMRKPSKPGASRDYNLWRNYRISKEEYIEMFKRQNGKCAICAKAAPRLLVDHSHEAMVVRGLLCPGCNGLLAALDRPGFLAAAQAYLLKFVSGEWPAVPISLERGPRPRFPANKRGYISEPLVLPMMRDR